MRVKYLHAGIRTLAVLNASFLFFLCASSHAAGDPASTSTDRTNTPREYNIAIPDVQDQFSKIKNEGEWLAAVPPSDLVITTEDSGSHYQGIVRAPYREGGPNNILYVVKNGEGKPDESDKPRNYLGTVQLASTTLNPDKASAKFGERFGSNLFVRDTRPGDTLPPILVDGVILPDRVIDSKSSDAWKHPGGMQMVGDVMAVPYEQPITTTFYSGSGGTVASAGEVHFYNCVDPTSPIRMNYTLDMAEVEFNVSPVERAQIIAFTGKERVEAGVVAITKLPNGKFMMMITYALDAIVAVFVSNQDSFFEVAADGSIVESDSFRFDFYDVWFAAEQYPAQDTSSGLGRADKPNYPWPWHTSGVDTWIPFVGTDQYVSSFQQLSLINQMDGRLFLTGSFNTNKTAPVLNGWDMLRLFEVKGYPGDPTDASGEIKINYLEEQHLRMTSSDGSKHGNGNAGISAYVSPTRELIFYSIAHGESPTNSLRISEYRHRDMAHSGNRVGVKFMPNHLGDPITIEQGENVELDASSRYISSWVDYYEDANYNPDGGGKRALLHEFVDQAKDDFDNFGDLDDFHDKMSSYRTGLEPEHALSMFSDSDFDSPMPGIFADNLNGMHAFDHYVGDGSNDILSSAVFIDVPAFYRLLDAIPNPLPTITRTHLELLRRGILMSPAEIEARLSLSQWEWDLDGDFDYELKTDTPTVTFIGATPGEHIVRVRHRGVDRDVDGYLVEKLITVEEPLVGVPDLTGLTLSEAETALLDASLELGSVSEDYSESVPAGQVIEQDPPAGTMVSTDTSVNLVISLGKRPLRGDIDKDGDVDMDDINLVLSARGERADRDDPRDLDNDGTISALDARQIVLLCTRTRCATN